MDLATHAIAGLLIARVRPDWVGRGTVATVLVGASLLPDVDLVAAIVDPTNAALDRHTLTHSLVFLPVMAAAVAVVVRLTGARLGTVEAFALAVLGIAVHLVLDLINAYGVALLHPWSDTRFELPLLFIVDPVLTGLLAALLAASLWLARRPQQQAGLARIALIVMVAYLGAAAWLRGDAAAILAAVPGTASERLLVPEPLAPWRWRGILAVDGGYRQVRIDPVAGTASALPDVPSASGDPRVAAIRRAGLLGAADPFLRAPVWTVEGNRVTVHDLRYRFAALGNRWDPFLFTFEVVGDEVRPVAATLGERIDRTFATLGEIWRGPAPRRAAAGG